MADRMYAAFPYEYLNEMEELNDAEFGRLARALLRYSMTGEPIALSGNERFYAKRVMNREDRYQEQFERNQEAGAKGGSRKREAKAKAGKAQQIQGEESTPKQSQAKRSKVNLTNTDSKAEAYSDSETKANGFPSDEGNFGAFCAPALGEELQREFEGWQAYKAERRGACTPKELEVLESEIGKYAAQYGQQAVAQLIRECIASGYQGILFDRLEKKRKRTGDLPSVPPEDNTAQEDMARMRRMLEVCRAEEETTCIR